MTFLIPDKTGTGTVSKLRFLFPLFAFTAAFLILRVELAEELFPLRPEDVTEIEFFDFIIRSCAFSSFRNININDRGIDLFIKVGK